MTVSKKLLDSIQAKHVAMKTGRDRSPEVAKAYRYEDALARLLIAKMRLAQMQAEVDSLTARIDSFKAAANTEAVREKLAPAAIAELDKPLLPIAEK